MQPEQIHSAAPQLRSPRAFLTSARRDLGLAPRAAWRIFVRGTQAQFRQTRLGYLWLIVPSLATTLIWVFLQSAGILDVGTTRVPYVAYVVTGTAFWQLFVDTLNAPLRRLSEAREVIARSRLAHEAWILAGVLDSLFAFTIRMSLALIVVFVAGVQPGWGLLLVPLGALGVALMGLAVGLLLTPPGLLYHDVAHGLTLGTSLWFFLTPVVYPVPDTGWSTALISYNPVTPLLVTARAWTIGTSDGQPIAFAAILVASLVACVVGILFYRLAKPHLVARL